MAERAGSTTVEILSSLETRRSLSPRYSSTTVEILSSLETGSCCPPYMNLQQQKFYQAWKHSMFNQIDSPIYNSRNSIKLGNSKRTSFRPYIYNSRNSIKLGNFLATRRSMSSTTVEILSSLETTIGRHGLNSSTTVEILSSLETDHGNTWHLQIYNSRNSIKLGNLHQVKNKKTHLQQQKFYQAWKPLHHTQRHVIYNSRNSIKLGNIFACRPYSPNLQQQKFYQAWKHCTIDRARYNLQQQKFYQAWKPIDRAIEHTIYNSRNSIKLGNTTSS